MPGITGTRYAIPYLTTVWPALRSCNAYHVPVTPGWRERLEPDRAWRPGARIRADGASLIEKHASGSRPRAETGRFPCRSDVSEVLFPLEQSSEQY